MKNIVVIYHDDEDGFGGAWTAWKKFKNKASYIPAENGNLPLKGLAGKEIYFIDFCYSKKELGEIVKNNKKVVVIDHHISRKNEIKIATEYRYAVKNSAAVLAWKYFYPSKPIPKILLYIEDMDLWKWELPNSRNIASYLESYNFNFKTYSRIASQLENKEKLRKCIAEGEAIERYKQILANYIINFAEKVEFEGQKAFAVNSPILDSEVGNLINKKKGGIGIIWRYKNRRLRISLRSDKADVMKLAEKFGGGGHKRSSGFQIKKDIKFPWKKKK